MQKLSAVFRSADQFSGSFHIPNSGFQHVKLSTFPNPHSFFKLAEFQISSSVMGKNDEVIDDDIVICKSDIFASYTLLQRQLILMIGALVAILTPFCDTVYLPALQQVTVDLSTTTELTSITVSAYLGAVGIGQLIWGPLSDYYGRIPVLLGSLIIFEAFTVACIFAQDIISLIALRTIEGFIVGSCIVSVQAIIADVFSPETRGAALGYFLGPMLIGPIIAPLIGGYIAEKYTWRADFVLLAVMTLPITLLAFLFNPETHHWYVVRQRSTIIIQQIKMLRMQAQNHETLLSDSHDTVDRIGDSIHHSNISIQSMRDKIDPVIESQVDNTECISPTRSEDHSSSANQKAICNDKSMSHNDIEKQTSLHENVIIASEDTVSDVSPPEMMMPWTVAAFLFDLELSAYYFAAGLTFSCMFTSLTLLPIYLSQAPYSLSETIVGVAFLPVGVAMLIAAVTGGILSDWSRAKYSNSPHGIMLVNLVMSCICPFGTIGFGFSLYWGKPLYAVLITQCMVGFGQAVIMPSTLSFLSTVRPNSAGAAGSTMLFLCFALAAVSISVSTVVADKIGVGYYFLIISCISALAIAFSLIVCISTLSPKIF